MYRALTRLHSSTDATPDELHALGQEIVGQVRAELVGTGRQLFGTSDLREIFDRLSNDPTQRYGSRDEMLGHARRVVAAAEVAAPAWFTTVPDEPCSVEPVPEAEEAGSPPAYYMTGAVDGSRQGTYFLNTSEPGERHRYMAEDMAFHEAVPGHHFQLTIARESARPARRPAACSRTRPAPRDGGSTASAWPTRWVSTATTPPAWACSPPTPGGPAGWSSTPVSTRRGWTRSQAVDWMAEHTPLPPIEIDAEVDRYISYPGQALSYMVGRREIERLRAGPPRPLGDAFDIKEFHDVILRAGIMPLAAPGGHGRALGRPGPAADRADQPAMASSSATVLGGQGQAGTGHVLLEVVDRRRARDEQDVRRALQQPRQGDGHGGRAEAGGDGAEGVGLQRGEPTEGEVGHVGDALGGQRVDQRVVDPVGDVVEVLHADDRGDRLRLGDLVGVDGADAEVADEPLLLQLGERAERLGDRPGLGRRRSPPTRRLTTSRASRPSRRRLSCTAWRSSSGERACGHPPSASRRAPDLGHEVQVVGVGVQRLLDDLVGDVGAVEVAGVDVGDAELDHPRSTATAPSRSSGGPKTPGPASCMAP